MVIPISLGDSKYRGYTIRNNFKTTNHRNPISGHEWTEAAMAPGFTISGPGVGCLRVFKTIQACKDHIDFILKFNLDKSHH